MATIDVALMVVLVVRDAGLTQLYGYMMFNDLPRILSSLNEDEIIINPQ